MQLTIDKTLHTTVKRASKALGLPEHELVQRAVSSYIRTMNDLESLSRELDAWDELSAATMRKYNF